MLALGREANPKGKFNSFAEIFVNANGSVVQSSNRGNDTVPVYRAESEIAALPATYVTLVRAVSTHGGLIHDGSRLAAARWGCNVTPVRPPRIFRRSRHHPNVP